AFLQNAEGSALGPQDCFLLLRGVKTLGVRLDRQQQTAQRVAELLADHPPPASVASTSPASPITPAAPCMSPRPAAPAPSSPSSWKAARPRCGSWNQPASSPPASASVRSTRRSASRCACPTPASPPSSAART